VPNSTALATRRRATSPIDVRRDNAIDRIRYAVTDLDMVTSRTHRRLKAPRSTESAN